MGVLGGGASAHARRRLKAASRRSGARSQAAKTSNEATLLRSKTPAPAPAMAPASSTASTSSSPPSALSRARFLVDALIADAHTNPKATQPILTHDERVRGSERGIGLPLLEVIHACYDRMGMLDVRLSEASRGEISGSACRLTQHTGLSIAESWQLIAQREGVSQDGLLGTANLYMCYAWDSTTLGGMLHSAMDALRLQEKVHGPGRLAFIDLFAASQNLISGMYGRNNAERGSAVSEDYDKTFETAFDVVDTVVVLLAPLFGEWPAPMDTNRKMHAYLDESREQPTSAFTRHGPMALTRAWCIKEISQGLSRQCQLEFTFESGDALRVKELVEGGDISSLRQIVAAFDFGTVQIRRTADRERIQRLVDAAGGFEVIRMRLSQSLDAYFAR